MRPMPAHPDDTLIETFRRLLLQESAAARAQFDLARERLDPAGRIAAGLAIGGLTVSDTGAAALGRAAWTLAPREGGELDAILRAGDPVLVYRKRAPDDSVRGLVSRRTRRAVTVVFDEPPDPELEESELVVERQYDDTTTARLQAGLRELEGATKGRSVGWREMLLGTRPPRVPKPGPGTAAAPATVEGLNDPQREAVARALAAEDIALVHGPPGTGKTEVLAAIAAEEVRRGHTILACAASNAAVDNLVLRLLGRGLDPVRMGHPARVHPSLLEHTLEARAERHEHSRVAVDLSNDARALLRRADRAARQGRSADRFAEARQARAEAKQLLAEARRLARAAEDDILERAPVICSTLTGLTAERLRGKRFDLALCDEATQAIWPATVLALLVSDRAVLAGDQHQLPPTVISVEAARAGLSKTLYERVLETSGADLSTMLRVQYRMHADIMRFPNETLYAGKLVAHDSVAAHLLRDLPHVQSDERTGAPLLFVDTAGKGWNEEAPEGSESRRNPGEAERIAREVHALRAAGVAAEEIGVIAPYASQVQLLRTLLPDEALEVDTVDAFQGREKEAICVSLVRSNDTGELGFLADVRRMNVALTRARRRLFVVGDSATIGGHPFYAAFLAHVQATGAWRSAWEE
jgi:superfamily I DNA and/or RNA helicase